MSRSSQSAWQGLACMEVKPLPNTVVIFGASGDLSCRKLIPAIYSLHERNLWHENSRICGFSRHQYSDQEFRDSLQRCSDAKHFLDDHCFYVAGDYDDPAAYLRLKSRLEKLEEALDLPQNRSFFLAVPDSLHKIIIPRLSESGLLDETAQSWRHVIIEKPFGHDLQSAIELEHLTRKYLKEKQIYRIDHYLGKDTIQNILMLRFANMIFEPLWNAEYIDRVEICAFESLGIENRAGYYEKSGALRDMFQNHMLEMLSLAAMEAPESFEPNSIRDEKLRLIKSIRPFPCCELGKYITRGQYSAGTVNGEEVVAYRDEANVAPDSRTETYVEAKLFIDNKRWRGVPFILRSGKRMKEKFSEIAIYFKKSPHKIFAATLGNIDSTDVLRLNIQPDEGMSLSIQAKKPGPKLCMGELSLAFKYSEVFGEKMPDAYERLIVDCMLGDQTLFVRSDVIRASWELFTPVLECWQRFDARQDKENPCPLKFYPAGSETVV